MKRIPFSWEGNPLYPLPADYDSLTVGGQRQARVCASRQWLIPADEMPDHPDLSRLTLVGDAAAASHDFFDHYYLHADPADDFDPFYYDDTPLPSADFHYDLVRMWNMYRQCLAIAPRSSAKSTLVKTDTIKRLVTAPAYSVVYCTLVHKNALLRSEQMRDQIYNNRRLNDDFGPEYGGPLRPSKHENSTGVELFYLRNKSWLQPISSEGRQRGLRPRRYRLDDPEHDEKASTSMINVREYMDRLVNRVIMPMVILKGRGFDWTATHVSKRHYSWHAMSMIDTPEGPRPRDARFGQWARYHIQQLRTNPLTQKPESCWPHAWPVDEEEKARLNLAPDTMTIADVRRAMGERAWLAEAQGQPGDSEERCFPLLADKEDDFDFWFSEVDDSLQTNPWGSASRIHFRVRKSDGAAETTSLLFSDLLRRGNLFACSDYSYTSNTSSDYKTCVVMLHDPVTNVLFVLDGWAAQCGKDKAIRECFSLCARWRVPTLFIEHLKGSITFFNEMLDIVRTKGPEHLGLSWLPAVKPLKVGVEPKEQKIESLSFRFEHLLIKFPRHLKHKAFFEQLLAQIEGFNPEAQNGGLEHDDCFPPSTPITTRRGDIPIAEVTTSDEVLTRFGWRRVLKAWCTGEKEVITRYGITATPSHPIWTEGRGWVPLNSLQHSDIVLSCLPAKPSSSKDASTPNTSETPKNPRTDPARPGVTSTLGTETPSTTTFPTLRPLPVPSISPATKPETLSANTASTKSQTWNLTVEEHPEFFAGSILVHNCIDTVAMSKFVLKGRRRPGKSSAPQSSKSPIQRLMEGEIHASDRSTALPLGLAVDICSVPASLTMAVIDSRETERPHGTRI